MRPSRFFAIPLALFCLAVIASIAFPPNVGVSQDTTAPAPEPIGSLVMRDAEGNTTGVTQVVASSQYERMIEEQAAMRQLLQEIGGKVDYLVTEHAVDEFEEANPISVYINTATFEELQTIPGIGAVKAGGIVNDRGTPGIIGYRAYESWQDLIARVSGVGPATVADMQAAGVQLNPPAEAPAESQ